MVNDKCLSDVGMIKAFQTFACTNSQTEEPVNESSLIHYASRNSRLDTHSQLQGEEADELSLSLEACSAACPPPRCGAPGGRRPGWRRGRAAGLAPVSFPSAAAPLQQWIFLRTRLAMPFFLLDVARSTFQPWLSRCIKQSMHRFPRSIPEATHFQ